jgi:hypothetical protein
MTVSKPHSNSSESPVDIPSFRLTGDFFYNEPFWDMSKNGGFQIFVRMDLKCSTYGPEHRTERFRSIEVTKNGVF